MRAVNRISTKQNLKVLLLKFTQKQKISIRNYTVKTKKTDAEYASVNFYLVSFLPLKSRNFLAKKFHKNEMAVETTLAII